MASKNNACSQVEMNGTKSMASTQEKAINLAKEFLAFDDASPSPYHATATVASMLDEAGFQRLKESEKWNCTLKAGGRYYFTREGSSIVAFALDSKFGQEPLSFALIGAHTDSPCLKLKPVSNVRKSGYIQVGVECYGGGLWHTWFDRDLTVAGRVAVREQSKGTLEMRLVHVKKPILRVPNLAIHLNRTVNSEGFRLNKEHHLVPILATQLGAALNAPSSSTEPSHSSLATARCSSVLLDLLATELNVNPEEIIDFDIYLSDTQPAAIGGGLDEFVFAPRLDNLGSCFTATKALINSLNEPNSEDKGSVARMICLFDHEEVGSDSSHGAGSPLVQETIERVTSCCEYGASYYQVLRSSMLVSADMSHAIHPNYSSYHEALHRPIMGDGLVIKTNQNQRYATSGITGLVMREVARRAGNLPLQEFVVPNDKPCGSTIGPIISSITGLRTVDVGQPMLSMHSIREMTGVADFHSSEAMFRSFFTHFKAVDDELAETAE